MAPSVSVLTGFDCLDFQDLVGRGGRGGAGGGGGGLGLQQSCPLISTSFLNGPVNYDRQSIKLLSRRRSLALCS